MRSDGYWLSGTIGLLCLPVRVASSDLQFDNPRSSATLAPRIVTLERPNLVKSCIFIGKPTDVLVQYGLERLPLLTCWAESLVDVLAGGDLRAYHYLVIRSPLAHYPQTDHPNVLSRPIVRALQMCVLSSCSS